MMVILEVLLVANGNFRCYAREDATTWDAANEYDDFKGGDGCLE